MGYTEAHLSIFRGLLALYREARVADVGEIGIENCQMERTKVDETALQQMVEDKSIVLTTLAHGVPGFRLTLQGVTALDILLEQKIIE